jgi:hypothetical protein
MTLLEDFLGICANMCLRKLFVAAKESENIQPGNAENAKLTRKGVKHATCANSVRCHSTRVNVSRDITHSTSTGTFGE